MSDIIEEVKQKLRVIEQLQRDVAKQEGQREELFKQLSVESGTSSAKEAEEKLEKLCKELEEDEKFLENLDRELGEIIYNANSGSISEST